MILATALNQFLLGRNWRLSKCSSAEKSLHRQVSMCVCREVIIRKHDPWTRKEGRECLKY